MCRIIPMSLCCNKIVEREKKYKNSKKKNFQSIQKEELMTKTEARSGVKGRSV